MLSQQSISVCLKRNKKFFRALSGYATYSSQNNSTITNVLTCAQLELSWQGDEDAEKLSYFVRLRDYCQQLKENDAANGPLALMSPYVGSLPDGKIIFYMDISSLFVRKLCEILPSPFIQLKGSIEVVNFVLESDEPKWGTFDNFFQLKDMVKSEEQRKSQKIRSRISCSPEDVYMPSETGIVSLIIRLDVILGWSDTDPNGVKIKGSSGLQILYGMASFTDVTIVSKDGTELKCHRNVIAAHSPVLAAMLSPETGMMESTTGRIVMPENSKDGVYQLIRYLYGFEITNAELAKVAVELFKTAHMYELTQLVKHLADLILKNATEMLSPDDILELYYYVKNIDELITFRCDLLRIMKSMHQELRACEGYKGLNSELRESLVWDLFDANN